MTSNAPLAEIGKALRQHKRYLVLSHVRPDGDAIGCSLAMGLCLKELGKDVTIWNEDGLPQRFEFLPESHLISKPSQDLSPFDVVVVVDTANRPRAGERCLKAVAPGALWLNIDHHVSNDRTGDLVYVDSAAPAAAEVLFELFTHCNLPITRAMALSLYVGISTDTGSFQYPSTTARTYEIAAELVRLGVPIGSVNEQLYDTNPRRRLNLLREVLNGMRFSSDERVSSFALTRAVSSQLATIPDDTEGLIETLRSVEGVVVAAFFEEMDNGIVRVSLRSKDAAVNVCEVCAEFGGGGHTLAAGARVSGSLAEVQERVLAAIEKRLLATSSH